MKRFNFITILSGLIIVVAISALILNRYEIPHEPAFVDDVRFERGEIIESGDDIIEIQFGESVIFADKNTEVKIIEGRDDHFVINVIQGRVVVDGDLSIVTREVETIVDGRSSFVHYSWLDEIEVAVIDGETLIKTPDSIIDATENPIKLKSSVI